MSDNSSYIIHGEINPWLKKNTTKKIKEKDPDEYIEKPWEQQASEPAMAYSAFLIYLDMGMNERSQSKLAKVIYGNEKSITRIAKWHQQYHWSERAESWDRFCLESRSTQMEDAVQESENIMLSYLPKVTMNLCQVAAGEKNIGRAQMRAITDYLDRIGPAKQRRSMPSVINNNLTVNAPSLPGEITEDTDNIEDAEIVEEYANDLIPKKLRGKKK